MKKKEIIIEMDFSDLDNNCNTLGTDISELEHNDQQNNDKMEYQQQPQQQQTGTPDKDISKIIDEQTRLREQQITSERKDEYFDGPYQQPKNVQPKKPQYKQPIRYQKPVEQKLIEDSYAEYQTELPKKSSFKIPSKTIFYFKEVFLLLILYYFLSLPFIQNTIASYLPQIIPNDLGVVSYNGVLLYGLILASSFFGIRNYIL